jgi:hypothetical protein
MTSKISNEIQSEQDHGRQKYGSGPNDFTHDDAHTPEDWQQMIIDNWTELSLSTPREWRQRLVKIAGLCVSAIESFDSKT